MMLLVLFSLLLGCRSIEIDTLPENRSTKGSSSQIGVSLGLFASDPLWNYEPLIIEISELGVEQLLIAIPLKQSSDKDNNPILGVPLEVLHRTIKQAQNSKLKITLMPIVLLEERQMNTWRGKLAPSNPDLWWRNYNSELKRIGFLAQNLQLERLIVGTELCSLEKSSSRWKSLILELRKIYDGQLTYSANWDHYEAISFWEDLDEISLTAYFPIDSTHSIEDDWQKFLSEAEEYALTKQRPLLITEYGYPSLSSALREPWNETVKASSDQELQAVLVERSTKLLLDEIAKNKRLGVQQAFLWNWFGKGGDSDHGYTLRGKLGEARFRRLILNNKHQNANDSPTHSTP